MEQIRDKKFWGFYLLGGMFVLTLKILFGSAGSDELLWILFPTALWAEALGGVPFIYEAGVGYVNHSLRFIIAPSCAGIRFFMISSLMLSWSFVHRMKTRNRSLYWMAFSILSSYVFTIFVNGIRIVLSIYLPILLKSKEMAPSWLTPEQLHVMIGTAVYFLSLLSLYRFGDGISRRMSGDQKRKTGVQIVSPVLWYLFPVLFLPFLSRIFYGDYKNFSRYEIPVLVVCGGILLLLGFLGAVKKMRWKIDG